MRPLFPPSANTLLPLGAALVCALPVGAVAFAMAWVRSPYVTGQYDPVDQPVQFDHRHHARDDGIACEYCHTTARRSPYAGVPATAVCMDCHGQVWPDSPALAPVRRAALTGAPIAWRRVHRLPDFVYFDHAAHVTRGVGCVSCHGRVDRMARVFQAAPLTMRWCLDCHRDPDAHLRPLDQVTEMDWRPSGPAREVGRKVREALGVRSLTNCTTCHR
jgi:hypothetical protein